MNRLRRSRAGDRKSSNGEDKSTQQQPSPGGNIDNSAATRSSSAPGPEPTTNQDNSSVLLTSSTKPAARAASSQYYAIEDLSMLDAPPPAGVEVAVPPSASPSKNNAMDMSNFNTALTDRTRSAAARRSSSEHQHHSSIGPSTTTASSPLAPPGGPLSPSSYYGTKNTRKSLEDDDPADTNSITAAHFDLRSQQMTPEQQQQGSSSSYGQPPQQQRNSSSISFSPSPNSPYGRKSTVTQLSSTDSGEQKPPARSSRVSVQRPSPSSVQDEYSSSSSLPTASEVVSSPVAVAAAAAAGDSSMALCTEHYKALLLAAGESSSEYNYIQELLTVCKKDQEQLQQKLNSALEDANFEGNLEELFALNDGICSAIDAGEKALKKVTQPPQKRKSMEGPTIELLVENEDIFSLICMLRASDQKKLASALALMKFARESEPLRNEIRSSGGLHSFLTLFRSNRPTRELQVVSSLAIAYILPSFVVSSQTTASLGLKIIECLCSLVASRPVNPQGVIITREEMVKAASIGVNIIWINVVQPLLGSDKSKLLGEAPPPPPPPNNGTLVSPRTRSLKRQATQDLFDQGPASLEIKELAELSVTLIVLVVKVVHDENLRVDLGYDIVEEICEIDVARPIVVQEGLLKILISWLRSKDMQKMRPAASALRYLISIEDRYMAGWIHSQVVNEGGVSEIVKLLNESVGPDIRLAIAQMISALCVASHTRAAVVEARVVSYLIALLFDHSDPSAEQMVECAARALVQLAAGAMTRSNAIVSNSIALNDVSGRGQSSVISEIVEGWAHGSFVQIVKDHKGKKLRSISIEALRVLSEDVDRRRQTRLHLCSSGAAEALGVALKENLPTIEPLKENDENLSRDPGRHNEDFLRCMREIHETLCALANMFEPRKERRSRRSQKDQLATFANPQEVMVRGCVDLVRSGGLPSIIWIASLSHLRTNIVSSNKSMLDRPDLLEEACRLLASLSPLLLSEISASDGYIRWANDVFEALNGMLHRIDGLMKDMPSDGQVTDLVSDLGFDALRGISALAVSEPLKMKIVDRTLPALLTMKSLVGETGEISTGSSQVFLALGFTEDEITAQVAGNNPDILVDWFCLQRAFILQAMARREIRRLLQKLWLLPYGDVANKETVSLIRQISGHSGHSQRSASSEEDSAGVGELFDNFALDYDSLEQRASILTEYSQLYGTEEVKRGMDLVSLTEALDLREKFASTADKGLMSKHVYPLDDITTEKEWILGHARTIKSMPKADEVCASVQLSERVERMLDFCFPSKLLQNEVIPLADLRPGASFNFRALMMPQRRYFSFRREGQLLSRLCEKQAATADSDDVHWTIGFTNSTFAGEFVESLVQTLYLCPMICGLSFSKNSGWSSFRDSDKEDQGDEGGGLLANLVGSIPPWVSHLTFDGILNDRDLRALTAIVEMMGNLASGTYGGDDVPTIASSQSQGKFLSLNIRNSLDVDSETWADFFKLLGRSGPNKRAPSSLPLSSLKAIDLSGNKLGDAMCGHILELIHDKDSGCTIEQIDLSGNRIGRGSKVVEALHSYVEYYRYSQRAGVKTTQKSWLSSLHTLNLSENDLFLGQAPFEIIALLKNNALCLRSLDLSNNSLEGDYQLLGSSLKSNTSLCNLNLSGNKFDGEVLDMVLEQINNPEFESGLSFLRFENNDPPLTKKQRDQLSSFLKKSRKVAIERYIQEKERILTGAPEKDNPSSLETNDEDAIHELGRIDYAMGRSTRTLSKALSPLDADTPNSLEDVDPGDNMITVLFSAPLVFTDENDHLHPFAKLDFEMERELLWQCMKEASRDIGLTFDNAHHSRLLATLTRRCSCLHYSGHGHPNFLPFEDGMGGPNWFDVQDIKELIVRDGVAPFKFVFVSACHSGLAGETFASAGVPHVVCCRQESELKDSAALAFTRQFYLALVVGHTVKESFEQGCKAVRATPNLRDPEKEMEKFVLLPKDGNHDVPVFKARRVSEWPKQSRNSVLDRERLPRSRRGSQARIRHANMGLRAKTSELSVRNMIQEDPSPTPPQFFMGREVELYYVLTALLKLRKRLVSVLGEPGVGRSSLVCALCHYVNERASTISDIQRIYFIKPKHGGRNVTCRSLLRQLLDKLEEVGKCDLTDEDQDIEVMLDIVCKSLKNDKALIVFDHTELLEKPDEEQELPMILSTLLYDTKHTRILLSGKNSLGQPSIGGQVEHQFNLGPLNFVNSVKLFANLCPLLHTPSERGSLLNQLTRDFEDESHLLPSDPKMSPRLRQVMSMLGDGIPAKIEKSAYRISKEDLARLHH